MRSIEADGRTIDLAISRALAALGAERAEVHVDILEGDAQGVLGIGRRKARVRATIRGPIAEWLAVEPDVQRVAPPATPPRTAEAEPGPQRARHPAARQRKAASRTGGVQRLEPADVVHGIFRRLGVEVTVAESGSIEVPGEARLENMPRPRLMSVIGNDVEDAIGRRGEVLEAIEYLVNRMLDHTHAGQRVALDASGYRAKRRVALEELVRRMATRARDRRRPVTLDPMGPSDRRIVLELLKGERGVSARSVGQGFYRKQTLTVEGARKGGGKKAR